MCFIKNYDAWLKVKIASDSAQTWFLSRYLSMKNFWAHPVFTVYYYLFHVSHSTDESSVLFQYHSSP